MLRNSIVQFSSKNKTFTLTDDKNKLPLNRRQSSKLFLTPGQSTPYIWVKIKENKKANIQLFFDSGDAGFLELSIFHFTFFQEKHVFSDYLYGYGSHTVGLHGLAKDTVVYRSSAKEMNINDSGFYNVSFETTSDNNSRIGSKLLDHGIVTIDYKNKKFYFEPFNEPVDMQAKQFPFAFTLINEKLSIGTVWDDKSPNQISAGDQVIEIDGVNYENAEPCDFVKNDFMFMEKDKISLKLKDKTRLIKNIEVEKK